MPNPNRRWLLSVHPLLLTRSIPNHLPLSDSFTDTNGVDLTAHAIAPNNPGGALWEKIGTATVYISGNVARTSANVGLYSVNVHVSDCIVSASVQAIGDNGVAVRLSDATHYWRVYFVQSSGAWLITEVNNGNTQRAGMIAGPFTYGAYYPVVVTLQGALISATVDGSNQISYNSAAFNQTATKHGTSLGWTNNQLDNFSIMELP